MSASECDDDDNQHVESLGKLKHRHKIEMQKHKKATIACIHSFKKSEKKAMRKMKETMLQQEQDLAAVHAKELEDYEATLSDSTSHEIESTLSASINRVVVEEKLPPKISRKERRNQAKAKLAATRRSELEDEVQQLTDERKSELDAITQLIQPLGFRIKEIRADGHCLYSSISHQLQVVCSVVQDYEQLRQLCQQYMMENKTKFLPFLVGADGSMLKSDEFSAYCDAIVDMKHIVWGGEPEIVALASALQMCIIVYSSASKPLTICKELVTPGMEPLRITYHQHYFGLGNHYNSVENIDV